MIYEPVTDAAGKPIVDAATGKEEIGVERCTACGICAKVCPPQCIWIVRAVGDDGKPKPKASEFFIDIDVCMNCGLCAEFCPFDAIKMDNDYELAGYERHVNHIYDLPTLMKSTTYYESIKPTDYAAEEAARKAKEEAKAKKPAAAQRRNCRCHRRQSRNSCNAGATRGRNKFLDKYRWTIKWHCCKSKTMRPNSPARPRGVKSTR